MQRTGPSCIYTFNSGLSMLKLRLHYLPVYASMYVCDSNANFRTIAQTSTWFGVFHDYQDRATDLTLFYTLFRLHAI